MRGILKRHLALDGGIEDLEACSLKRKAGSLCTVVTVRRVLTSVALVRSCCIFYGLVPFLPSYLLICKFITYQIQYLSLDHSKSVCQTLLNL